MKCVVICDDSKEERTSLREVLEAYFAKMDERPSLEEYGMGETLLADVEEGYVKPDLVFLDIYMQGRNGMETAHGLREKGLACPVVFLTTTPDFAVESYDVQAFGYLLKPLDEEKLHRLLERLLRPARRRQIAVKNRGQMRYFYVDEIAWIESDRHVLTLHFRDGSSITTTEKLGELEEKIESGSFLRCHQSYLVNMACIADVREDFILEDGARIPIRVRSRKKLVDAYYNYFIEHTVEKLP